MTKPIFVSIFVAMLCGPALAAPTSTPTPPAIEVGLRIAAGNVTRHYGLILIDHECGRIQLKDPALEDNIRVCPQVDGANVHLEVDWSTRDGEHELHNNSAATVAHGHSFDLDVNGTKLTVSLK